MGVIGDDGAPAAVAGTAFPEKLPEFNINDSGGEVSASIEETNKMRAALGLKPLVMNDNKETKDKERAAHKAKVEKQEKDKEAAALREKLAHMKATRKLNDGFKKTKTLGAADDPADDNIASWVTKSRTIEEKRKEEERLKAEKMARALAEQDDDAENDSDDEGDIYTSKDLAGLKVKHSTGDMNEGETVILTLEDHAILDEDGNLNEAEDELQNVRAAEEKQRRKAREAAKKVKAPTFGEDEEATTLLGKYDEAKEDEAMQLDESGAVDEAARRRQEEIRRKLKEGAMFGKAAETLETSKTKAVDYYTKDEMATFAKPKKKLKKKLRKKKSEDKVDLDELEREAMAAGGGDNMGSRSKRADIEAGKEAQERERDEKLKANFDAALSKAEVVSRARLLEEAEEEDGVIGDDEGGIELQEQLARARRAALAKAPAGEGLLKGVAASVAKRAEQGGEGALLGGEEEEGGDGSLVFTTTTEFVRNVSSAEEAREEREAAREAAAAGAVVVAEGGEGGAGGDAEMEDAEDGGGAAAEGGEEDEGDGGVSQYTGEAKAARGMAGALALMRQKGELKQKVEWAGRNNDKKKSATLGLHEADERFKGKEVSLIHKDEFGRVLTPKEAFRQLAYRFHGITPSKNKQEKRLKQVREELLLKRMAAGDTPTHQLEHMKREMTQQKTPFLVLSGSVKAGQISDTSGFGLEKEESALANPGLAAGGQTPLTGDKKVEAMYGIKRPPGGGGSMPPPASKKSKKG